MWWLALVGCVYVSDSDVALRLDDWDLDGVPASSDCDDGDPSVGAGCGDSADPDTDTDPDTDPDTDTDTDTEVNFSCGQTPCYTEVVACAERVCGLEQGGRVDCWAELPSTQPGPYSAVDTYDDTTCALTPSGEVECWGFAHSGEDNVPVDSGFGHVTVGWKSACAANSSELLCWGDPEASLSGWPSFSMAGVQQLDAGQSVLCGIFTEAGGTEARCIGGAGWNSSSPRPNITQVSAGAWSYATCGIRKNGDLDCWEADGSTNKYVPGDFVHVHSGDQHACAVDSSGDVHCVGANLHGERLAPSGIDFVKVAAGFQFSCGLSSSGTIHCWGDSVPAGWIPH